MSIQKVPLRAQKRNIVTNTPATNIQRQVYEKQSATTNRKERPRSAILKKRLANCEGAVRPDPSESITH